MSNAERDISMGTLVTYNVPAIGFGYMFMLFGMYFMKFSTDVLYIAPAIMGTIFGLSRLWDSVIDPLVGYMSDKTNHSLGRRRPWMIASAIPLGAAFFMAFSPPQALSDVGLILWIGVSVFAFYTAMSLFVVPHMSLGAELTDNYHDRSRIFGGRYIAMTAGYLLGLMAMAALIDIEPLGDQAIRELAAQLALIAAIGTAILIIFVAYRLREPQAHQHRGSKSPLRSYRDVITNRHARPVFIATFIENLGLSITGVLTFYVAEYVILVPEYGPLVLLVWLVFSLISIPLWVRLSHRFGKRNLWGFSMVLSGLSYGSLFFLQDGAIVHFVIVAVLTGSAAGCGGTVSPSLQSDVIDYDEYLTGERKEGSYFAAWNFLVKAAGGITVLMIGYVLQLTEFTPRVEQTETVKFAMLTMVGLVPMVCYWIGALILSRFSLNQHEHSEIRLALDERLTKPPTDIDGKTVT
ncbi:MAG: MFS transporter [Gammaproteobacteria bacterium]|nr:MFS transporter [Gammaproteobacteria bacterium]